MRVIMNLNVLLGNKTFLSLYRRKNIHTLTFRVNAQFAQMYGYPKEFNLWVNTSDKADYEK